MVVCVSRLRFMFAMNVLQPRCSVNTRTWAVNKRYELFYMFKILFRWKFIVNTGNWSDLACNASFIHWSSFKLVNTLGIS